MHHDSGDAQQFILSGDPSMSSGRAEDDSETTGSQAPTEAGDDSVARPKIRFSNALSWSYVLTSTRLAMTLLVSLVLARLLGPEAFGLVAMGLAFIAFIELLAKQGLSNAIIQQVDLRIAHFQAAFWLIAVAILVLTPLAMLSSAWWAAINETPRLHPVLLWLSLLVPLKGLAVVPEAQLMRAMDFRALAIRAFVATAIGGMVGIIAALLGAGVWALVAQQLTMAAIELALVWQLSNWLPQLRFEKQRAKELLGFSSKITLASFAVYLERQADSLLIGLFFGPVIVGLYRMANRLASVARELASGAVRSTYLPELARFEDDREAFLARSLELLRISMLLALPLLGALVSLARPILGILGDEWLPALVALQMLAIAMAFGCVTQYAGPLLQAIGRPGLFATTSAVTATLSVAAFLSAGLLTTDGDSAAQVTLVAGARAGAILVGLVLVILPVLQRVVGIRPSAFLRTVAPTVLATSIGVGAAFATRAGTRKVWPGSDLADIATSGTLYALAVTGVLVLTEPLVQRGCRALVRRMKSKDDQH